MQQYILRIFRENREGEGEAIGVLQDTATGKTRSFHSLEDLCDLLRPRRNGTRGSVERLAREMVVSTDSR